MKQNKTIVDVKVKKQELKRLRELAYKEMEIGSNGITIIAEDEQKSVEAYALNRLSISVNNTEISR